MTRTEWNQELLDLVLQFGVVFKEFGQTFERFIQYTTGFTGFHHGDTELIEDFGPLAIGCWRCLRSIEAHFGERPFEHRQLR